MQKILLASIIIIWILPAIIFTIKVKNSHQLTTISKKTIYITLWTMPLVGTLFCCLIFAKVGHLERLSENQHRSIWIAGRRR